jgi:hypothetical protein
VLIHSDNNDEMDDYIEAQLDKKNSKGSKGGKGGSGSKPAAVPPVEENGAHEEGAQPSLAMKPTKLD